LDTPDLDIIKQISRTSASKIVLLVIDGLGGLPRPQTGKTELETAATPNLDALAQKSICGMADMVRPGITPGSAPGHLALFGYDPLEFSIGRGALEALGIDFDLAAGDIAARGNFCALDKAGLITDRRAGRISTEKSTGLCRQFDGQVIDGVKVIVRPVKEHRFVAVFRGQGLSPDIDDSDPQQTGVPPKAVTAIKAEAKRMADIANRFIARAKAVLAQHHPANMILLRGFSVAPDLPTMTKVYKLKPAAIASYPMYRGLAKAVGMETLKTANTTADAFETLKQNFSRYDFFFVHIKGADAAGEDGDFNAKVAVLEQIDTALNSVTDLKPDVLIVSGDHSTPALLKEHSWHPVPVLLHSRWCRPDQVNRFSETACALGGLGRIRASQIMPLAMANALKLAKFGA
jgi:2,3-bisphosphoglycerate-independent phosphoglycerate mutase